MSIDIIFFLGAHNDTVTLALGIALVVVAVMTGIIIMITQCLLAPTGGVSNRHKSTIDTDSSVDPVPCT